MRQADRREEHGSCSSAERLRGNRRRRRNGIQAAGGGLFEMKKMLTREAFEEASQIVRQVTEDTRLVYSDYFSSQCGN